jgi:hypothetical protein
MKAKNGVAPIAALLAAAAVALACNPGGWLRVDQQGLIDGGKPPCPSDGGSCVEVSPASSLGGACTNDRWLALLASQDDTCPVVGAVDGGTWEGGRLFAEPGGPPIPPALLPYCVYEWSPSAPGNPANTNALGSGLGGTSGVSKVEQDCFVVGPSGDSAGMEGRLGRAG